MEKATVVTKKVKLPVEISMTGEKVALNSGVADELVAALKAKFPIKIRLGRGRKETIQIGLKPATV